ncbi:MAG TPA: hypothetical protein VD906_00925 [Caulobacteraceae bacterium]|nr:hypothetical protein [Caulobacteraceae bacterium]
MLTGLARDDVREALPRAAALARQAQRHWDFSAPAHAVDAVLAELAGDRHQLRRAAVAGLCLEHLKPDAVIPPSVEALYPEFLERLAEFLAREGPYEDEFFSKDVRYATGLTVPCGAMAVDLHARIGPKLLLRDLASPRGPKALAGYLTGGGLGVWLSDHIDVRDTRDMNPAGWTRLFERIADLLEANPAIRGVIGVGWIYDPVVGQITPRLDYCRKTQVENGAFLIRVETGEHHTANATATSATRRRLVEEGKYVPTCYLIAWPRRPLIGWARRVKSDPSLAFA